MTSEVCLKRGHNVPCGFRLTGGINFHMPLTVFEVEEGSLAYEAGIRLGDILVQIDGKDTENMSLDEAQKVISLAGENVQLSITTSDDPEDNYEEDPESSERIKALIAEYSDAPDDTDTEQVNETLISEASEQRETTASIDDLDDDHSKTEDLSSAQQLRSVDDSDHGELVTQSLSGAPEESISEDKLVSEEHPSNLYENVILEDETFVDVHSLPLKPPQPAPEPEKPVRKCWHPVMLDTSPPPIIEESTGDEEWPHKKTMRELRKAIAAKKVKATPEETGGVPTTRKTNHRQINDGQLLKKNLEDDDVATQLRTMQKQIAKLSALPATLLATLQAVSVKIDDLIPVACEQSDNDEEYNIDEGDSETSVVDSEQLDYEEEEFEVEVLSNEEEDYEAYSTSEMESKSYTESSPEPNLQEIEKREKQVKLEGLNRCWPWADDTKQVYKIADHYDAVYAHCIGKKVQLLEEKVAIDKAKKTIKTKTI